MPFRLQPARVASKLRSRHARRVRVTDRASWSTPQVKRRASGPRPSSGRFAAQSLRESRLAIESPDPPLPSADPPRDTPCR